MIYLDPLCERNEFTSPRFIQKYTDLSNRADEEAYIIPTSTLKTSVKYKSVNGSYVEVTNSYDHTSDTTVEYGISVDLKVYCDHLEHELDEVVSNQHNFDNLDEKRIDLTESTIGSKIEFINNICKESQQHISDFTEEAFVSKG